MTRADDPHSENTMIRTLHIIRWTSLGLIVLLGLAIVVLELRPHGQAATDVAGGTVAVPGGITLGGPFQLTDDKGRAVTDADYRGRWMLVFFGYSNCPDECPLTLQKMAGALSRLGPFADKMAPIFITVDPARDTPERLKTYLASFDPRITGLTGSDARIAAAAKAYRVFYAPGKHEESGADLVNHSTFLYLMDPAGKFSALLASDIDANRLAGALGAKLKVTR
ncbi:MAG: SCO family protein [Rhodospirillales bacterium]|nr:SCO family protein [Rhodospirillales bacterium]